MGTKQERDRNIVIGIALGLIIGIILGMFIQQAIMIKGIEKAGKGWEGVISEMNIEININETKLVEATYNMFPELNMSSQNR